MYSHSSRGREVQGLGIVTANKNLILYRHGLMYSQLNQGESVLTWPPLKGPNWILMNIPFMIHDLITETFYYFGVELGIGIQILEKTKFNTQPNTKAW